MGYVFLHKLMCMCVCVCGGGNSIKNVAERYASMLRRFEPSQETGVKRMKNGRWQCVVEIDFVMICERVWGCNFFLKLHLVSGFTLANSTGMVTLQDVQLNNVTSGCPCPKAEVIILVRKYPENYQTKKLPNFIFPRMADRIATKFCMTI